MFEYEGLEAIPHFEGGGYEEICKFSNIVNIADLVRSARCDGQQYVCYNLLN